MLKVNPSQVNLMKLCTRILSAGQRAVRQIEQGLRREFSSVYQTAILVVINGLRLVVQVSQR